MMTKMGIVSADDPQFNCRWSGRVLAHRGIGQVRQEPVRASNAFPNSTDDRCCPHGWQRLAAKASGDKAKRLRRLVRPGGRDALHSKDRRCMPATAP